MARTHDSRVRSRRELLEHRKKQMQLGYDFPLLATGFGLPEDEVPVAHVRRLSLQSAATLDLIPTNLQDVVNEGLAELERIQKKNEAEGTNTDTLRDRISNNTSILPAADAFCLATFIEPRLTEHEQDATEEVWWVGDVAEDDRLDIFFANLNKDSAAAKRFRIHRPQSVVDVGHRPAGPRDDAEPIRVLETAGRSRDVEFIPNV